VGLEVDAETLDQCFDAFDLDKDGGIKYWEFVR
jgi:Ca2+-binding EF-hand superfamily protein